MNQNKDYDNKINEDELGFSNDDMRNNSNLFSLAYLAD